MAEDKVVQFQSKKHPWLVRVQMHDISMHMPQDSDTVKIQIPEWAGVGHFVVNFDWARACFQLAVACSRRRGANSSIGARLWCWSECLPRRHA